MANKKKGLPQKEEDPQSLTDEECREYWEKDARTTNMLRFFKAVWEAV